MSRGGGYWRTPDTLHAGAVAQLRVECGGTVLSTEARRAHVVAGDVIGLAFLDTNQQGIDLLERWIGELAVRNTMATPKVDSSDTTIDVGPNRELEVFCVQRKCLPLRLATAKDPAQAKERTAALAS